MLHTTKIEPISSMKNIELKSKLAYEILEEMITFQELKPGQMYSESKLIAMTELGRSPIREALQKLVIDKMIEIYPSKGILITPISLESQARLLEVRRNIGEFAMQLAAKRADNNDKNNILSLIDELNTIKTMDQIRLLIKLLKKTHSLTVVATKNEFVDSVLSPLQGLSRRFWIAYLNGEEADIQIVASLYMEKLTAISQNDVQQTTNASLKINDYFTNYTHKVLKTISNTL